MKGGSVIRVFFLCVFVLAVRCSEKSEEQMLPAFVISDLLYEDAPILITDEPYFSVSGSLHFSGAQNGLSSIILSTSETEVSVPVTGIEQSGGQLVGYFMFEMITIPGTYPFRVWLVDRAGRSSNKLSGTIKLISNAPPTPVILQSVIWDDVTKTPLLTWTKNNDSNFKSYVIVRHQGGATFEEMRIDDQQVTSAHAISRMAIGFDATYRVDVINLTEVASPSNQIELKYGESLPFVALMPVYEGDRPVMSSARNEMYFFNPYGGDGLLAVSTTDNTILRSHSFNSNIIHFALSHDDSKLYVVAYHQLSILNAENFNLIKQVNLNFNGGAIVCGRPDRLYVVSKGSFNGDSDTGQIKILDSDNGNEIGDVGINVPGAKLTISPDHNTLYIAEPSTSQLLPLSHKGRLYQLDISNDVPVVLNQHQAGDFIIDIQLSADGKSLYVAYDMDYPTAANRFLDVWSTAAMQSISTFNVAHPVIDFIASSNSLFISMGEGDNSYFGVIKFDLTTREELNSWEFLYPGPLLMQVSQQNKFLYAFEQDKTWLVEAE